MPITRKCDKVREAQPIRSFGNSVDTTVIDNFFADGVSSDTADSRQPKVLEVPISQAAKMLGTSERTVWRRIERGELKSRTKGQKRLVKVSLCEPHVSSDTDRHMTLHDTPQNANTVVDLSVLLRELQGANYRVGFLEAQNQSFSEQLKLLPDFQSQAAKAAEHQARVEALEQELSTIKGHWWYRFWKWMLGA